MKNERSAQPFPNQSNNIHQKSQSCLPTLNLSKKTSLSKEKKLNVHQDNKSLYSNLNFRKLIGSNKLINNNKESKIRLKSVKIISSLNKNPKTASQSPNLRKGDNKIFLRPSPPLIKQNNTQTKPKTTNQGIIQGLNIISNDKRNDRENVKIIMPQSYVKPGSNNYNNRKRYRIKANDLLKELMNNNNGIKDIRNSSDNCTKDSPIKNKNNKKYNLSLSLKIASKNNFNANHAICFNNRNKYADTDPKQQQEQEIEQLKESIYIREIAYKENPNLNIRKSMEDFHYINQNVILYNNERIALFAIFDGHNGSSTALYCQLNFERLFKQHLKETQLQIEDSITKTFIQIDEEINQAKPDISQSGSTATVIIIYKNKLYCANVGDSSCFIFLENRNIKMTKDHNPKDPKEVKRIKDMGGLVFNDRVFGTLNLTRVLGDIEMKKYGVLPNPTIHKKALNDKDKYIILASDGVWNYFNEHKIQSLIKKNTDISATNLSEKIVSSALENGSLDNISCIIIKL